jgi:serine/threonine-protein kinase SRPK3
MLELVDESVLEAFTHSKDDPSPRKFGAPIYLSRQFGRPRKFGDVVLSVFGAAVRGDRKRNHDAQPNVYRSPEVILKTE